MKLYIPFNSNDFNNVFSTLSISPRNFYYERDFGFKRATQSKLNPFEDVLLAFKQPTFISQSSDYDNGYPINLVVVIDGLSRKYKKADVLFIKDAIYLFDDFEVLYRTESEKKEVESKSLKSIETKFLALVKSRSRTLSNSEEPTWFDKELSKEMFKGYSESSITRSDLKPERQLNKIIGALIGFAVGSQRNLPEEFRKLNQLSKELKNQVSLFINRIGQPNEEGEKKNVYRLLSLIQEEVEKIISLDNYFLENTDGQINEKFLSQLQSLKLKGQSYFRLVINGLLNSKLDGLPLPLKLEKAKQVLYHKISKKYPQSYIERLNNHIKESLYEIEDLITKQVVDTDFDGKILEAQFESKEKDFLNFKAIDKYGSEDCEYLRYILNFFINEDTFTSIDELHGSKKEYLGDLGKYLKEHVKGFEQSAEAQYLRDLLSSFKSLTEPFDINSTSLDSLKSVALLFTKGRDFMQYREFVENSSIVHNEVGYAIWGAAFGYAGLPKTLTGSIFDNVDKCELVLDKLSDFTSKHVDPISDKIDLGELKIEDSIAIGDDSSDFEDTPEEVDKKVHSNDKQFNQDYSNSGLDKDIVEEKLEKFLNDVKVVARGREQEIFLNVASDIYLEVEKEIAADGDLFGNNQNVKVKKFSKHLNEKSEGIKGIGEKTIKSTIDIYCRIISNDIES